MQTKPVLHSGTPEYPTRGEVAADEGVLREHMPRAWKLGGRFAAAVTVFVAANLAGCGNAPEPLMPRDPEPIVMEASDWIRGILDTSPQPVMLGCIAVMPPAYLPEDAAIGRFE